MNEKLFKQIISSTYKFGQIKGQEFSKKMRFWSDGRISGYHHNNEFSWELNNDDELLIFNIDHKLSHIFKQTGDDNWVGEMVLSKNNDHAKHYLTATVNSNDINNNNGMEYQTIGKHVLGRMYFLTTDYSEAKNHLKIGNFTSIAPNVSMVVRNHNMEQISTYNFMSTKTDMNWKNYGGDAHLDHTYMGKVIVGSDVWLGENVMIVPNSQGITIGNGSVVGANSVVTKDIPPYAVAVGNPARVVKYRFSKKQIEDLLEIKWWDFDDDIINNNLLDFNGGISVDEFIEKYKK